MKKQMTFGEWCFTVLVGGGVLLFAIVVLIPLMLLDAWLMTKMWAWFFVAYFHLPPIRVWLMVALVIFFGFLRDKSGSELKPEFYKASAKERVWAPLVLRLLMFGVAYLIHLLVLKG